LHIGIDQIGVGKQSPIETRMLQVGILEVHIRQYRSAQIRPIELSLKQNRTRQICIAQIDTGQTLLGAQRPGKNAAPVERLGLSHCGAGSAQCPDHKNAGGTAMAHDPCRGDNSGWRAERPPERLKKFRGFTFSCPLFRAQ
jgi:hypothetical protein